MSSTEYRFDGLDALERRLAQLIEQQYPAEFRELVIQIARELQTKVKEKTPVKTGRLQDAGLLERLLNAAIVITLRFTLM